MKIAVVGTGYVGLVTGVCMAELGNEVACVDIDAAKIANLQKGILPIYEPGLKELLDRNIAESRLAFTTDTATAIRISEVVFSAVGTPEGAGHKADLTAVFQVARTFAENLNGYKVFVTKSTVPVGTNARVKEIILKNRKDSQDFDVVSNPEFLREGEAVNDFLIPDRIVIGCENGRAKAIMEHIYKGIARTDHPILFTDISSAEIIKYAANAMLATRISFMNEVAKLCEKTGADIKLVAQGMGMDKRIGSRFLQAGIGYGGSCFPKDVKAFIATAAEHGIPFKILTTVDEVNELQKQSVLPKLKQLVPHLQGASIALWGLAFKPKTDDMREAPAIVIIRQLLQEGAHIRAFDPEAAANTKRIFPSTQIHYAKDPYDACHGADAIIIITEWNEFRALDLAKVKSLLRQPNIIDGRNVFDPADMKKAGFRYIGVGR
ncbi:UDP-glucose/GDP-mannose dehydrogenase family protein [Candidatus Woesearchaeota archaeon]|nr:UDP-glucose/GDP-mannose dehydrogenase family protein [Candidatus Woesearchaeota archaeon]